MIDLQREIVIPKNRMFGRVRCRVDVTESGHSVQFSDYSLRTYEKVGLVHADISYAHKWSDRTLFQLLFDHYPGFDDFLIARNGFITDMTIANVALLSEGCWFTPAEPLLAGTMRERLLQAGELIPRQIHISEVESFEKIRVLNAMMTGLEITYSPQSIVHV